MSTPIVPPRPAGRQPPPPEIELPQQPQIPPRPSKQRGVSPGGRNFVQSPFNERFDPLHLTKTKSNDPIRRPPSVSAMPGLGSEGNEYGEIQYQPSEPVSALAADAFAQTRNISEDLKLHAPKPSLPTTSATAQVQAVTRTDSVGAAAHGIGRPPSQDGESLGRTRSRASFSRPDSAMSDERRRSVYEEGPADHGGFRVPINPLLGDVQAPSPAPGLSPHHTGASHDGKQKRHHRTSSGREVFLPPGSYGLHGHGMQPAGNLEKDWYAKHPRELEHEEVAGHGVYESIGSGRGAFALSSDDLNKIVRNTASKGSGFGTSGNVMSYPDEQIGYAASDQYSSKRGSIGFQKAPSNVPASPLRKASFPTSEVPSHDLHRSSLDAASASEADDVHIDAPSKRYNKITGGEESMNEREDVKPYLAHPTEVDGLINEHGYTVPILAGDELAKEVGHEHLQPAVSPSPRRGSDYEQHRTGASPHGSRPSSRPGSIHGLHSATHHSLQRYISHHDDREHVHTPLEDVDEYEPLFPDDDGKKAVSTTDRFKQRPEFLRQRFPSQDIWEDTPDSAMYQAEVTTPDLLTTENRTSAFELPEAEHARKGEASEQEREKLIPAEERLLKSKFAPHLRDDMPTRPGLQPRFPSSDVWEDSPDSQHLVATVNSPEPDDEPPVPQRPEQSRLGEGASSQQIEPSVVPSIPPRPQKKAQGDTGAQGAQPELKKVPSIPDRPKPQIPVRPAKKETEELSRVTSGGSSEGAENVTSPPPPKAKPQVPARPSSKIANLRGNFMNDLNQKLGLGPPKEKDPEPEPEPEETKPLEDARKSRARGPQRRAPPKAANAPARPSPLQFSILAPQSMWSIDDSGSLNVRRKLSETKKAQLEHSTPADAPMAPTIDTTSKTETEAGKRADDVPPSVASPLSTNTAGEPTDPAPHGEETLSKYRTNTSTTSKGLSLADTTDDNIVSQQTTASDSSGQDLERVESIEPTGSTTTTTKE